MRFGIASSRKILPSPENTVKLNGHPFTIVGVAPKYFTGADIFYRPDIYVPAAMAAQVTGDGADTLKQRSYRAFDIHGRLNPGVTLAQAQAELNSIMSSLEREHPDSNKDNVAIVRTEMGKRMELGMVAVPVASRRTRRSRFIDGMRQRRQPAHGPRHVAH